MAHRGLAEGSGACGFIYNLYCLGGHLLDEMPYAVAIFLYGYELEVFTASNRPLKVFIPSACEFGYEAFAMRSSALLPFVLVGAEITHGLEQQGLAALLFAAQRKKEQVLALRIMGGAVEVTVSRMAERMARVDVHLHSDWHRAAGERVDAAFFPA